MVKYAFNPITREVEKGRWNSFQDPVSKIRQNKTKKLAGNLFKSWVVVRSVTVLQSSGLLDQVLSAVVSLMVK